MTEVFVIRVLHLETGRHLYGGAGQVFYLIEGLADLGIDGTVVCAAGGEVAVAARDRGLDVITVPMAGDLDFGFAGRFRRRIRQIKPDLIHVHSRRGADTLGGLGARWAGVPAVLSRRVDNPDLPVLGMLKYRFYQRIVAISAAVRRQLVSQGIAEAKLHLVRDAIDPTACRPVWSHDRFCREFKLAADDIPVAVVAQFIERKGHHHLFEALRQLGEAGARIRVVLFGRGPLAARLEAEVASAGLQSVVQFAGYRADLLEFLGHFRLLVHPALHEGLGVGLLEAQAAGVPVVGFRAGGVTEAVADGRTGILVRRADSAALAAAIAELVNNPAYREQLARAAPEWVAAEFGIPRMVRGNLDVYTEVLREVEEDSDDRK